MSSSALRPTNANMMDGGDPPSAPVSVVRPATNPSRRALVSSAMASIQRFKQSWISIMVLKAGIGLGQVVALASLLCLASTFASPLHPSQTQVVPSDACPRPELFQAWMGVQLARLSLCWGVSCFVCIRQRRSRRREIRSTETNAGSESVTTQHPQAHQSSGENGRVSIRNSTISTHTTFSQSPSQSQSPPSLIHSNSTDSASSLSQMSISQGGVSTPTTPVTIYGSTMGSTLNILDSGTDLGTKACPVIEELRDDVNLVNSAMDDVELGNAVLRHAEMCEATTAAAAASRRQGERGPADQRNLQAARQMAEDRGRERDAEEVDASVGSRIAMRLDACAGYATKALGATSAILFILGNVLLFTPPPSEAESCYTAAPMLWWGVMTVTGVGWFLVAQVVLVMLGVGIGGPMMLALLRTLRIVPTPLEPEPPRAPQLATLRPEELANLRTVCYIPDPNERHPVIQETPDFSDPPIGPNHSRSSSTDSAASASKYLDGTAMPMRFDPTRLPYPPHPLRSHQTTCAICQENFTLPSEARTVMMRADPLRLLGCGHVYHVDCIDQWLLNGSGNCPFCNRSVRETSLVVIPATPRSTALNTPVTTPRGPFMSPSRPASTPGTQSPRVARALWPFGQRATHDTMAEAV